MILSTKEINRTVLITTIFQYLDVAKEEMETVENKEIKNLLKLLSKLERKHRVKVSPQDGAKIDSVFEQIAKIDREMFEDRNFSSVVMVILLMDYIVNEIRDKDFLIKYGHFNYRLLTDLIELNFNLRKDVFYHHQVVNKIVTKLGF